MQKIREILHEINNADQIISEIREQIEKKNEFDLDALFELQKGLERSVKLFNVANDRISDAIIKDLEERNAELEKLSQEV